MLSKVSIIIPSYNREQLISHTLDSVLSQTYQNWECLIIDDGSTDNSINVYDTYTHLDDRFRLYVRPKDYPKGPNSCRNYGYLKSTGNWIKWLDSDDILLSNALEEIVEMTNEKIDVIVHSLSFTDVSLQIVNVQHNFISKDVLHDYLINKIQFYVSTPTWSRIFLEKQSLLFRPEISNLDDWDFNLRMLYKSPRISFLNKKLLLYRRHGSSLSQEIDKNNIYEIQSELSVRNYHIRVLTSENSYHLIPYLKFVNLRYKQILRNLSATHKLKSIPIFLAALKVQYHLKEYNDIVHCSLGYFCMLIFKRGYRFFQ